MDLIIFTTWNIGRQHEGEQQWAAGPELRTDVMEGGRRRSDRARRPVEATDSEGRWRWTSSVTLMVMTSLPGSRLYTTFRQSSFRLQMLTSLGCQIRRSLSEKPSLLPASVRITGESDSFSFLSCPATPQPESRRFQTPSMVFWARGRAMAAQAAWLEYCRMVCWQPSRWDRCCRPGLFSTSIRGQETLGLAGNITSNLENINSDFIQAAVLPSLLLTTDNVWRLGSCSRESGRAVSLLLSRKHSSRKLQADKLSGTDSSSLQLKYRPRMLVSLDIAAGIRLILYKKFKDTDSFSWKLWISRGSN